MTVTTITCKYFGPHPPAVHASSALAIRMGVLTSPSLDGSSPMHCAR